MKPQQRAVKFATANYVNGSLIGVKFRQGFLKIGEIVKLVEGPAKIEGPGCVDINLGTTGRFIGLGPKSQGHGVMIKVWWRSYPDQPIVDVFVHQVQPVPLGIVGPPFGAWSIGEDAFIFGFMEELASKSTQARETFAEFCERMGYGVPDLGLVPATEKKPLEPLLVREPKGLEEEFFEEGN